MIFNLEERGGLGEGKGVLGEVGIVLDVTIKRLGK